MSDERHILQCECADCMNRGGGQVLAGMGVTSPDPEGARWSGKVLARIQDRRARSRSEATDWRTNDELEEVAAE